ncbi:MAG: PQQ-dependent sugar dehydrogenase, partial [Acidobacteria bacterium]|nr:PQQ-dependent sugar dehydrogenase [Acidobacteriota bacterium]
MTASPQRRRVSAERTQKQPGFQLSALPLRLLCVSAVSCCLALLLAASNSASYSAAPADITLAPVLSNLSEPVYVGNAHDGSNRLFIVEQAGLIKVLQPGASDPTAFLDIRPKVVAAGELGLLGLCFHPQYQTNRRFYVNYTRSTDAATVIAEYQASAANPNVADVQSERVLLVITDTASNHNGGMIEFGPDGYLYIGVGDGGFNYDPNNRAQNIEDPNGKILRIDVDHPNGNVPYSVPPSNPFYGPTIGLDEIYTYGMRNPWRFSFDRGTGQLWIGDVGEGQREEVNIGVNGGNYGWRIYEGTGCTGLEFPLCTPPGFTFPLVEYSHTGGRCSIAGGYVYRGFRN